MTEVLGANVVDTVLSLCHVASCKLILLRIREHYLWLPYGLGQAIIFSSCSFFYLLLLSFFLLFSIA